MDPTKLIDWLRLPQRVLWGFVVVIALMLWGPEWFISGLGLEEFIEEYRRFIGVFFLFFLVAALPNTFHSIWQYGHKKSRDRRWMKEAIARLHDLTPPEKQVLKGFVSNNTRTRNLDLTDGVTRSLVTAQIIYQQSQISVGLTYFAYQMHPWAFDHLRKHPELLD